MLNKYNNLSSIFKSSYEKKIAIHWFRFDLRIFDNPSLNYLSKNYENIVGIYVFDDINSDPKLGSASRFG